MATKTELNDLLNQDWSKFDFTRWNLEGLNLSGRTAALAGAVRDASISAQPKKALEPFVSATKSMVLQDLQGQVKTMQERITNTDLELKQATATTQAQIAVLREQVRAAGLPPAPAVDPESFQVGIKAVEQSTRVGLPGLEVRVFDVKNPGTTLASGATDQNGNAVLKLTREQTDALTKNNAQITFEVLAQDKKSVFTGGQSIAPKLNQTGALMASIQSSPDLTDHLNAGNATLARQQQLLTLLTSKLDALPARYKQIKDDAQQHLADLQDMIASLQTPSS